MVVQRRKWRGLGAFSCGPKRIRTPVTMQSVAVFWMDNWNGEVCGSRATCVSSLGLVSTFLNCACEQRGGAGSDQTAGMSTTVAGQGSG